MTDSGSEVVPGLTRGARVGGLPVLAVVLASVSSGCAVKTRSVPPTQPQNRAVVAVPPALEHPERVNPDEAETLRIKDAVSAAERGDYSTAQRIFRELLQANPTLADAYVGLGAVHERQGELALAESAYARAVALDPDDFNAVLSQGRMLLALGRSRDAMRAYQHALRIRPADAYANIAMSRLMLLSEQAESAVAFAQRAVESDPQECEARLQLARALAKAGRRVEAIKEYEASCQIKEPTTGVLSELVNAYASEQRYREAASAAERLATSSASADAYERLGWALFRLGEYERSDTAYRKAIELDGNCWRALNGIGVNALNAWVKAGKPSNDPRRTEAADMLRRSMKANPDQPKVAQLLMKYQL